VLQRCAVDDQRRVAYLREHIAALRKAIAEGLDVRGYLAWSLLDNFEWSFGYGKRFGIVHCDFKTQARTIKASGHWYARFIESGKLDG
jgi:beta-glucosidase